MKNFNPIFVLVFSLLINQGYSEDFNKEVFIAHAKTGKIVKIGLVDCITYALRNNSEIKIKRIEPKLKEDDIKIAKADFEPSLGVDFNLRDNTKESPSALSGANIYNSRDTDINVDLSGKLITGTEYKIDLIT